MIQVNAGCAPAVSDIPMRSCAPKRRSFARNGQSAKCRRAFLWAPLFWLSLAILLVAMSGAARADGETLGALLQTCAQPAKKNACWGLIFVETINPAIDGKACFPNNTPPLDIDGKTLAYLREQVRQQPALANNDEAAEVDKAFAALWPCH